MFTKFETNITGCHLAILLFPAVGNGMVDAQTCEVGVALA